MEDDFIVQQILYKLDGWTLEDEIADEDLTDMEFNKSISSDEVLHFYNVAYNYALSYTQLPEFPTITKLVDGVEVEEITSQVFTALTLWSAGLIYRKYNIRTSDNIDDTMPIGYGDSLIIQAKEMLKTIKGYRFYAY